MANTHSLDLESSSSQYASITDASQTGLDLPTDFSIALWVRWESLPASNIESMFVTKWKDSTADRSYTFHLNNNSGTLQFRGGISTTGSFESGNFISVNWTPITATWYHIAMTFEGGTANELKYFVNGSQQGSTQSVTGGTPVNNGVAMGIGVGDLGGTPRGFFDGLMDEIVITTDILSATELSDLYGGADASTAVDNIVAYWKLNNDYTDESGNSNTLTATASPVFSTTVPFANYTADAFTPTVTIF